MRGSLTPRRAGLAFSAAGLLASGCATIIGFDGLHGDATDAGPGARGDASLGGEPDGAAGGGGDASTEDGAPAGGDGAIATDAGPAMCGSPGMGCSTHAGAARCFDFDDGGPPVTAGSGTARIVGDDCVSSPSALFVTATAPIGRGSTPVGISSSIATANQLVVQFDVRFETKNAQASILTVVAGKMDVSITVDVDTGSVYLTTTAHFGPAGVPIPWPFDSGWHHVVLTVASNSGFSTLQWDNSTSQGQVTPGTSASQQLSVGITSLVSGSASLYIDNVVVEVQP